MTTKKLTKWLALYLPYILLGLVATNFGEAWRLAEGKELGDKIMSMMGTIPVAFANPLPSLYPLDLLVGLCCGAGLRLAVYLRGKNAKKYRHGMEYGSARWGTPKDIEPFMAPKFADNIILTKTERLMMSNRPPDPKNARNKNVLVVGGSGSGKTRFWLKPNLLQCHSSYVVTDPKGSIVVECGNALLKNGYKVRILNTINFKKSMLKAGYMENDLFHATELGTPQGGILSPLLSNVYLNDFDWYVGRMYMEPHRQCKHKGNDTRRLKWAGVTPKYNYRYADDWVILTSTEKEALRLKRVLTKYFRNRMKLELSQEKTYVTDLRTNGIHFLGFVVKAERKRKTPDPATWTKHLVGKPLPDMERLGKKIKKLLEEVHRIELCQKVNVQAAQIQYVNSVIMGMAQYLQTSICSRAYHAIDRRVNNAALAVWKKLYPKRYNSMQVSLKVLCNLPDRHKGYDSKTFAVWVEGKWFGITYAFITHSHYEPKPFDQKMTPYTVEGRRRYVNYRAKHKSLPCDRPSVNSPSDIAISAYAKGRMNFEYYMNREYAYSRDKGKCKCCGNAFSLMLQKNCHHVKNKLPLDRINKVPNLVWLCEPCHRMVHNSPIPPELNAKTVGKIMKYREKLKM